MGRQLRGGTELSVFLGVREHNSGLDCLHAGGDGVEGGVEGDRFGRWVCSESSRDRGIR